MTSRSANANESHAPTVFADEIEGFTTKSRLSRRESEIVVALIRNITNSEDIAKHLGISTHTVNNHLKSIFEKTTTKSKTEILSTFLRYAADQLQTRCLFVKRPRVLVIDDEPIVCDAIAGGLSQRGLRTLTLTDPSKANEMIAKFNIDFVICDVVMPAMSGLDVLKEVRSKFPCWPYFAMMTGNTNVSVEEWMHQGAAGFFLKPIDIDTLFQNIMSYLADSGDKRTELANKASTETIVLDEPCRLNDSDIGFGGAFIPMEMGTQKKARVGIGSVVDVVLSPKNCEENFKVRGEVVWKRSIKGPNLKAGVGVRFLNLSEHDQSVLDNFVREHSLNSFIPIGDEEANKRNLT